MAFGDEDFATVFMTDFAECATWNGIPAEGLYRVEDVERSDSVGQLVRMQVTVFRVPTAILHGEGVWAGLADEDSIVYRHRTYRVRDRLLERDGAITLLILAG